MSSPDGNENDDAHQPASELLRRVAERAPAPRVTLGHLIAAFGERSFGFALILFAIPNTVPVPGLGTIFGMPLMLIGAQMALGRAAPWLPRAMGERGMETASFVRMVALAEPRLRKVEAILRPRLTFLFSPLMERMIGVFVMLCSVSIMLPFPGSNFPPAIALILISLAVMAEDGVVLLAGVLLGAAGLTYTTVFFGGIAWAGISAMMY
jgi:hypothetical protein